LVKYGGISIEFNHSYIYECDENLNYTEMVHWKRGKRYGIAIFNEYYYPRIYRIKDFNTNDFETLIKKVKFIHRRKVRKICGK
jgi:hypothetical protein